MLCRHFIWIWRRKRFKKGYDSYTVYLFCLRAKDCSTEVDVDELPDMEDKDDG